MGKNIISAGRKIGSIILLMTFILTLPAEAYAAPSGEPESSAVLEFTEGEGPTTIVDPEKPVYSIDPHEDENGETGVTNNRGSLRIDYVSNFKFGSQAVQSGSQQFHAALIPADAEHTESGYIEVPNFVQLSDLRGTKAGWTLSVKQDDYFKVTSGELEGREMTGARITLDNIITNTARQENAVQTAADKITFTAIGEYYHLMTAVKGEGTGTHVAHFGEYNQGQKESARNSVILEIPAGIEKTIAPYQTSFTWLLADVPDNGGEDPDPGEEIDETDEGGEVEIDDTEWIILSKDEESGMAELIRKDIVAERPYQPKTGGIEWEWGTSDIREWLRTDFRNTLSAKFQAMITEVTKETHLPAPYGSWGATREISETVYLLDLNEYRYYLSRYPKLYEASADWWLRTPYHLFASYDDGFVFAVENTNRNKIWQTATYVLRGVRPVVTVKYK